MTVHRGQDWGSPGPLAPGAPVVDGDAALIAAARPHLQAGDRCEVGLVGGDLHRTLGAPLHSPDDLRSGEGMRLPIDVGEVVVHHPDGSQSRDWFCAHLVAVQGRGRLFAAPTLVVMNAAFRGADNLGPRAHPGDGLLDATRGRLGRWDRLRAQRRMPAGTHVPHPGLSVSRSAGVEATFDRPATVVLDGVLVGRAVALEVRCRPDAVTVVA